MDGICAAECQVYRVTVGSFSRRYFSKYDAIRAYCRERLWLRLVDRGEADALEDKYSVRIDLQHGNGDYGLLMRRYYRYVLQSTSVD